MRERWLPVKGFEGKYEASSLGNIRNVNGHILRPAMGRGGYLRVSLSRNGKGNTKTVHRIIAEAFLPASDGYIDHINEIKTDNRASNLEFVSHRENCQRYWKNKNGHVGVHYRPDKKRWRAQISVNAKLTSLGSFKTKEAALKCYLSKSEALKGAGK